MGEKIGSILNNFIGAILLIFLLYVIKRKTAGETGTKVYGLSIKTISIIIYAGILVDLYLIVQTLIK